MEDHKRKTLARILNIWLGYNLFLVFASQLPHLKVPVLSWVVSSVYLLLFMFCVVISRLDGYNRDMFANLAGLFLLPSLSLFTSYVGNGCFFGDNNLMYRLFVYRKIGIAVGLGFFIVYATVKYVLPNINTIVRYGMVVLMLATAVGALLGEYVVDEELIFKTGPQQFYSRLMYLYILCLLFVALYGFLLFKYDRPNGKYVNALMMMCLVVVFLELLDLVSKVYQFYVFKVGLYILTANLVGFAIILLKKFNLCYSEFGKFYEQLVHQPSVSSDLVFLRDEEKHSKVLALLGTYFEDRRNRFIPAFVFLSLTLNLAGASFYLQLNFATGALLLAGMFIFVSLLHAKRHRGGNILLFRRK